MVTSIIIHKIMVKAGLVRPTATTLNLQKSKKFSLD